ncbi:calcium-activated chloride channel regulator 1-like isoform X2 [Dermacentor albipictus]|uniref:calcium-activated chloride channel regulator 1-like isoform X2 n=1 Tax=Dermacentor albipictus TaxID=60249 RepID=UPI0038FC685F
MYSTLAAVVCLFCVLRAATALEIDTSDGGYTNLVVAIDKDVPYNESIIENIKALLRSSSEFLHRATSGRVYFKRVVIDIPHTWPERKNAWKIPWNIFNRSDVRVSLSSSTRANHPFTKQVKPCGHRGEFIQLSSEFLAELNASTTAKYANPAYVFVHEWAHYRYGVFDEHGNRDDDRNPLTYCDKDKVKLNSCSERIRFTARTPTGKNCKINKDCQFRHDCVIRLFQPRNDTVESSVMFMPYLSNVTHFCNNIPGTRKHNSLAPNKQNKFCRRLPAWDVIRQNEDFRKLQLQVTDTIQTVFGEVKRDRHLHLMVVLVLDVSGSMNDKKRLDFMKEAVKRYLRNIPDDSVQLAIVAFESTAHLACELKRVNKFTRQDFIEAVDNLTHLGGTCISCGLELALKLRRGINNCGRGTVFILMSDGEHHSGLSVADVKPKLVAAKVEVTTMMLGPTADSQLEELANATGGKSYAFQDLQGRTIPSIEEAFLEATRVQLDEHAHVVITREEINLGDVANISFLVDPSIGRNTTVHIWRMERDSALIDARLSSPNGCTCDACSEARAGLSTTITIPDIAETGTWTLHMKSSSLMDLYIEVNSQARNAGEALIRVVCDLTTPLVHDPDLVLYAHVNKGDKVVLYADVVAEVLGPNWSGVSTTPLRDDGCYPDITANDGTYSGFFTAYAGRGRYAVMVRARNHNESVLADPVVDSMGSTSNTLLHSDDGIGDHSSSEYLIGDFELFDSSDESPTTRKAPDGEKSEAFERTAIGGSFEVAADIREEHLPPLGVFDLRVTSLTPGKNGTLLVKVTWTWPGAHLTSGKASFAELRVSAHYEELLSRFDEQAQITDADVLHGSLAPLPSGAKHVVTVHLPATFSTSGADGELVYTAFLAVRFGNSEGLKSNISNIVSVYHSPHSPKRNTADKIGGVDKERILWWIWLLVAGMIVVFSLVLAILVMVLMKRKPHRRDIYFIFSRKRQQRAQDPAQHCVE